MRGRQLKQTHLAPHGHRYIAGRISSRVCHQKALQDTGDGKSGGGEWTLPGEAVMQGAKGSAPPIPLPLTAPSCDTSL